MKQQSRVFPSAKVHIGSRQYSIKSDFDYLNHIYPAFESDTMRLFETLISDTDICLDVGANVGCTTIGMANLSKSVFAFEPVKSTFDMLRENVTKSGLSNITLFNFGLGEQNASLTIAYDKENRSGAHLTEDKEVNDFFINETVELKVADEVLFDVDFIKIDVEGYELCVLKGMHRTILKHKPTVFLEANNWCLTRYQDISCLTLVDNLKSTFPFIFAVDGTNYLDLMDRNQLEIFFFENVVNNRFQNLICFFEDIQSENFKSNFSQGVQKDHYIVRQTSKILTVMKMLNRNSVWYVMKKIKMKIKMKLGLKIFN